ncbi:ubiquitin-activating enzyme [Capsaspora owczarzaki ATCC 30864]|uniref:ubiquitin-activating enzyme n=1 Tax=Capsaspora owczarzaki (strain ATCC 30864) TaxID=595528 RepID=UPI0003522225|nr:ubiquitin-activating enzyme [Capsaspora owczarzaki ATCC 30864]|eukprot:XP_004346728.2 ubiquitin-activating enzyme [Capsaspora owczarzaki ATCC 30864]
MDASTETAAQSGALDATAPSPAVAGSNNARPASNAIVSNTNTAAAAVAAAAVEDDDTEGEGEDVAPRFEDWAGRWDHIDKLLVRRGPFAQPTFEPCVELRDFLLEQCRILVIGAGGLGCELLKDLALSGFRNIDVIDMDTIDISNLNRQFLFRQKDVGQSKALVAAEFVNRRVAGCKVTPHFCKIQDKPEDFYRQFQLVVCGLDSIPARRWINALLVSLVQYNDDKEIVPGTMIPMIDGGTEGFKGQARVILPGMSSCFECSIDTFPPQTTFPLCTIASTPRIPAHCIEYAKIVLWPQAFPDRALDTDDPEHINWLYLEALKRANEYGIQGVTYRLTQGVVKNIIPAVASTNAVIAAACASEAFKLATGCSSQLNNYMQFNGQDSLYTFTFEYEQKPDCLVCSNIPLDFACSASEPLRALVERLSEQPLYDQFKAPGIRGLGKTFYMSAPPSLELSTRPNLDRTLAELGLQDGAFLQVADVAVPLPVQLKLQFRP